MSNELVGLGWPPGLLVVLVDRRDVAKNRIDDSPLCLDGVLAHEERPITLHRARQKAIVWCQLVGGMVDHDKLGLFAAHDLARNFDARDEIGRASCRERV